MASNNKVQDTYPVDEDWLSDKATESDYWKSSHDFYIKMKRNDVDSLSSKQLGWIEKIYGSYNES